jgi:hypothetical protein
MDKDSMDSDIMKDLEAYRKEQEIRKLRNINEVDDSENLDSLCDTPSLKSDTSPVKIKEQHMDEFDIDDERIRTFSQDSLRKTQKDISPHMKDLKTVLGPHIEQR